MNKACIFLFLCSMPLVECGPSSYESFLQGYASHYLNPAFLTKYTIVGCALMSLPIFLLSRDPDCAKNPAFTRYATYAALLSLGALGGFIFGRQEQSRVLKRLLLSEYCFGLIESGFAG